MSLHIDTKYIRLLSSRLRNFKQKKEALYNFSCPLCGDSKKNLSKARGYVFAKGNDLFYRCHNCGVSTNLANLIKQLDPSLHKEYILERYKSGKSNNASVANSVLQLTTPKFGSIEKQKLFEEAEWLNRLPNGHFCLEYVKRRNIPKEHYDKLLYTSHYKKFIDTLVPNHGKQLVDDARLVIPFYNEYNELIAVSGRALESGDKLLRYVTVRTNENQNKLIYGIERINKKEKVILVEGPIDSLFLYNCVASGDANLAQTARDIPSKDITLVFDNEPRNKEIVRMMQNAINDGFNIVIWPNSVVGKDINEMIVNGLSSDDIQNIISNNTYKGLRAQLTFNVWKKV